MKFKKMSYYFLPLMGVVFFNACSKPNMIKKDELEKELEKKIDVNANTLKIISEINCEPEDEIAFTYILENADEKNALCKEKIYKLDSNKFNLETIIESSTPIFAQKEATIWSIKKSDFPNVGFFLEVECVSCEDGDKCKQFGKKVFRALHSCFK